FASSRQHKAAVFLVFEQSLTVEALDHVGYARFRYFKAGGDIDHARVSLCVDQLQDPLQVILHGGRIAAGRSGFSGHEKRYLTTTLPPIIGCIKHAYENTPFSLGVKMSVSVSPVAR